jgi:TolB-like protein
MNTLRKTIACLTLVAGALANPAWAEQETLYPAAILQFQERGDGARGRGGVVADLLFGELVAVPELMLVEREELKRVTDELELGLSGMVSPSNAAAVGQLTGARIIITGSVIEADRSLFLVVRIIGTETSRVLGASVKGRIDDDLSTLVEQLAQKTAETILQRANELVAPADKPEDRIAELKKKLGDAARPVISVRIPEQHIGRPVPDPAAETEIKMLARAVDFEVLDAGGQGKQPDIVIEGEGFSEFAVRRGNLISVKARLEVKAVERSTGKLIAVDRQTVVAVDVAENIAGKTALQQAGAQVAERLLPKLVKPAP